MASKRDVIEQLKRDELLGIVEEYDVEVRDRRVNDDLVDAVVRAKRIRLAEILTPMSRDRLKEICTRLELDDTGREKAVLIDRICGDAAPPDLTEKPDASRDTAATLARLLSSSLALTSVGDVWPALGELTIGDQRFDVSVYARMVGGSSRGNALERRFQNPSQHNPIADDPNRYELLFGLWVEQGDERAVVVAFDVSRRVDRSTRFSMFMPLSLLEQAADTGFATHDNTRGETIYAFRPENIGRYVQAMVESGDWRLQLNVRAAYPRSRAQELKVAEALAPASADSVYIRPRVGMYAAFARLNYKPWFAVAEFLDNSIQSFLHRRDALTAAGHEGALVIDINLDDNELSVTDRAGGISWADFPRAFSPACPPDDASGLSEFGLGMKAAACWFSKRWTVRTSALGEAVERTVAFDIPAISRDGLENLPIEVRPARDSDHFTVVTMRDLRVHPRGRTLGKIKDHLSSIYRVLMNDGLVKLRVTTNGVAEDLQYNQPELLEAPYYRDKSGPQRLWRAEFEVDLHDRRVKGWAGVLKQGSHARAGFSVFRRRRLIEGSVGETYKPHAIFGSPNSFESQRVVGEIFVEGFDVTHTKDGIQWGGYEDEVLESIRRQLDSPSLPLLDQANGYRSRRTADALPMSFGAAALGETIVALSQPATGETIREEVASPLPDDDVLAPAMDPNLIIYQRAVELRVFEGGRPWTVQLELIRDPTAPFYKALFENGTGDNGFVRVSLNLEHQFSVAFINDNEAALQPVLRIVAALAIGEKLARDSGIKNPGEVRRHANEILKTIGAGA